MANSIVRRKRVAGVDWMRKPPVVDPPKIGLLLKCINDEEIEELRNLERRRSTCVDEKQYN